MKDYKGTPVTEEEMRKALGTEEEIAAARARVEARLKQRVGVETHSKQQAVCTECGGSEMRRCFLCGRWSCGPCSDRIGVMCCEDEEALEDFGDR